MLISRKARKKVESWFYGYISKKKFVAEKIDDLTVNGLISNYSGMPHGSGGKNVIESGIANVDVVYRECKVVEQVLEHFREIGRDKLIDDKYFKKMSNVCLSRRYTADIRTILRWTEEIVTFAVMVSLSDGLISIEEINL